MKLVIVHGSMHKGNTYRAAQIFVENLKKHGEVTVQEFFLPRDMPKFCIGCVRCLTENEKACPQAAWSQPVLNAMLEADALMFTTPVYMMSVSGGMKNFLDHFPFLFMIHRPQPEMFHKKVMILSTAAGAGMKPAMKPIYDCVKYWGVNRIYRMGFRVMAKNWDAIPQKRRLKYELQLKRAAGHFWKSVQKGDSPASLFCRFMFTVCKNMHKAGKDLPADHRYWEEQGWLAGKKPY